MNITQQEMEQRIDLIKAKCNEDEHFVVELVEADNVEAFEKVLTDAGIGFEEEGMEVLYNAVKKEVEADLDEVDLEEVNGGLVLTGMAAAYFMWGVTMAGAAAFLYGAYKGSKEYNNSKKKGGKKK